MPREARSKATLLTIDKSISNFHNAKDEKARIAAVKILKTHAMDAAEREETKGVNVNKVGIFFGTQLRDSSEPAIAKELSNALVEIMCDPTNNAADAQALTLTTRSMILTLKAEDTDPTIKKTIATDLVTIAKNSTVGKKTGCKLVDPITAALIPHSLQQANEVIEHVSERAPVETILMPQTLGAWLHSMTPASDMGLSLEPIEGKAIPVEAVRTITLLGTNARFMFTAKEQDGVDGMYIRFDECVNDALGRGREVASGLLGISSKCRAETAVLA
jgi:hypothetical protein